ncbi:MAG: general secretion pathway protein GspF [Proteobacteria bacterium]|nr:general secretion pathway protein GspF [Pseudomonadota bacterium]
MTKNKLGAGTPESPFMYPDHKRPVTRRDFLARGFLTGAGILAAPSLMGFFNTPDARAQAMTCGVGAGANKVPFLAFDLAGGASFSGSNVLVGGPGGQLDPLSESAYIRFGLPTDQFPTDPANVNTELGLAFHADSAFLRGIKLRASDEALAKVNGTVLCARSSNDTQNNPHNPMYGIAAAGAAGDLVALVGSRNSESGGNSMAPASMIDPAFRPTKVDRPSDATGMVDTGQLVDLLSPDDAETVMDAVHNISATKLAKVNEQQMVKDMIECAYVQSADLVANFGNPNALDPRLDDLINGNDAVFNTPIFTPAEIDSQSKFRKTASVMKLVSNGFAGAGTVEMGGYDYHNGTRATGEVRDEEAGECMGAAIEYAHRTGTQLMMYVFSDGSLDSDGQLDNQAAARGKLSWRGDNSTTAAAFILVYDPGATDRPLLTSPTQQQIGYFRSSGSVETDAQLATRLSNNVPVLAESIVLNYLALNNEVGMLDSVLPGHGLGTTPAELDELIAFAPLSGR